MSQGIKAKQSATDRREIRVFISSTFRDMQEEREELVKQIFPQLRRLCESRGVTWGEVDLRWGVPDEAKAEGKVLPLCLQEIEHCRPYFIGLLGERYGWVPEDIPESLFETQPWLREHLHQSVTALEILHGVLRNPDMEKHAFFYFRDPAYAAAHPGFTEEDPLRRDKLTKLKDDIRKNGFPVSEPFDSPKQLGEWVLRDLTAVIEQLFPKTEIPNALDRAALDHEAYSASRRTVYIGRQEYMDRLNAHAACDGPPLVIAGESGGGKSALVANWTHNWSEQHPETPVLVHFIGAAPDSANWMAMLRRLQGEFQRKFGIQIEIPDQPDALRMAFANALHMVAARGRLVLALDALNQIEDRDGAPDLVWLPPVIPANVRLVVSTLPGRSWDDLSKRGWPVLTVEPLTVPEREELIDKYLKRYAKALSPGPAHRIAAAPQSGNGLYLSTLLNELRQFGSHESLNERIDWYLQAANPIELYRKVIERWEQDYGQPDPACGNVVRASLTHLWAARRGLSETELLESLGTDGSPLPRAFWSPVYLAAGDAFLNRGGLLTFAHTFLCEAVRNAYLLTEDQVLLAHRTLAIYFEHQPHATRRFDELPWQCEKAEDWQGLFGVLSEPDYIEFGWDSNEFEVLQFWKHLHEVSPYKVVDAISLLSKFVYSPDIQANKLWRILAHMIDILSHFDEGTRSIVAYDLLAEHWRDAGDLANLAACLGNKGLLCMRTGQFDDALGAFAEQESAARRSNQATGVIKAIYSKATILAKQNRAAEAIAALKGLEDSVRKSTDASVICEYKGVLGGCFSLSNEFAAAAEMFREQEYMARFAGRMDIAVVALCNRAFALHGAGNEDGAFECAVETERTARQSGSEENLLRALSLQISILPKRSEWGRTLELCGEVRTLARKLGNQKELFDTLFMSAAVLSEQFKRFDEALAEAKEAQRIAPALGPEMEAEASRLVAGVQRQRAKQDLTRTERGMIGDDHFVVCQGVINNIATTQAESLVQVLEAVSLENKGGAAFSKGDSIASIRLREEALHILNNLQQVGVLRAIIQGKLQAAYASIDDFQKAVACGRAALEWLVSDPRLRTTNALCMHDLGSSLINLGEFVEGITYIERSIALLSQIPGEEERVSRCLVNLEKVRALQARLTKKQATKRSILSRLFGG